MNRAERRRQLKDDEKTVAAGRFGTQYEEVTLLRGESSDHIKADIPLRRST